MNRIYKILYKDYGPQGWWPLITHKGTNPTKTGSIKGYHPGDYHFPVNNKQRFEIMIGALLTQNTSWTNVEKAITNLDKANLVDENKILKANLYKIAELIKPAGYYNQKAERLQILAKWFLENKDKINSMETNELRKKLLGLKGVGPETADSILLYAFKRPLFVIDTYTKRIFSRLEYLSEKSCYDEWQELFMDKLKHDVNIFNEYHALIVEHAKRHCKKKPICDNCVIKKQCNFK